VFIGTGTSIIPRTQIGARAVIGAGAAVISEVPSDVLPWNALRSSRSIWAPAECVPIGQKSSEQQAAIALTARSSESIRRVCLGRAAVVPAFSPLGYVYALGALEQHPRDLLTFLAVAKNGKKVAANIGRDSWRYRYDQ